MNLQKEIRKMAKSSYWQGIYKASKDTNGIQLFNNKTDLSGLQYLFLYWLKAYNILYEELMTKESEYLTEDAIKDDIRCDAYLYYRQRQFEKRMYQARNPKNKKGNRYKIYQKPQEGEK